MSTTQTIDQDKLDQFMGRFVGDLGASLSAALVVIGDKLGLYRAMADGEPTTAEELASIEITPSGFGLHFPKLDADLYVPAVLEGLLGSTRWMAARMGALGGKSRSEAKAAASRENGKLGGRPRIKAPGKKRPSKKKARRHREASHAARPRKRA